MNTIENYSFNVYCNTDNNPIFTKKNSTKAGESNLYNDNKNSHKKSIRVELSENQYSQFRGMAKREKVSLRHLAITKMFDSPIGLQEYKERQARLLPSLHALIDQVDDDVLQCSIRRKVAELYADL